MAPITLALLNGRSWPKAVAVAGDRIAATGHNAEIAALADERTAVLDCAGLTISAGFIDAHCHVLAAAKDASMVDCSVHSIAELTDALSARLAVEQPRGWLRGRGYHEDLLCERRHPTRRDLDRATDAIPVRITHASGHASVLNSAALALLGIDCSSEEPAGGSIEREAGTGEPNGVFIEMEDWLDRRTPERPDANLETDLAALSERFLAAGVTSVQDLGHRNDRRRAELLAGFAASGVFRPRLTIASGYEAFAAGDDAIAEGIARGPVKIMLNEAGDTLFPDASALAQMVDAVHRRGRQAAIHAIGAPAIAAAIHAIGTAQAEDGRVGRHRIEHAALATEAQIERMGALGIVPVSNPAFLWEHGDRYLDTVSPSELPALYNVGTIVRAGRRAAAGSDAPIGPIEPATGIRAICRRVTKGGRPIPNEQRRISLAWALLVYTLGGAFAAFEEQQKGSIAAGMLADITLLDIQRESARPVATILGGRVVWQSPKCRLRISRHEAMAC